MIRCHDALVGLRSRLILQIHDELMIEAPPEEIDEVRALVTAEMIGAWELDPPLSVDVGVGESWLDAK